MSGFVSVARGRRTPGRCSSVARWGGAVMFAAGLWAAVKAAPECEPRPGRMANLAVTAGVRLQSDSNLFLQEDVTLGAGQSAGALPAEADDLAAVGRVELGYSAKAGAVRAAYALECWRFERWRAEDHEDQSLTVAVDQRVADTALRVNLLWRDVDGSKEAPVFNRLGGAAALGAEAVRLRRDFSVIRLAAESVMESGLLRGRLGASFAGQDFHTRQSATPFGYSNYVDTAETVGGGELGWCVPRLWGVVARVGLQAGRQSQGDALRQPLNYSNRFRRWFAGVERSNGAWTFAGVAGAEAKRFGAARGPDVPPRRQEPYLDVALSWTTTARCSLLFAGKKWFRTSSASRGAFVQARWELAGRAQLDAATKVSASVQRIGSDYKAYCVTPRRDVVVQYGVSYARTIGPGRRIELSVTRELAATRVPLTPARAYDRTITGLTFERSF